MKPAAFRCSWHLCVSVLILSILVSGCGDSSATVPVTGTVKFESGEPLTGANVLFQPVDGGQRARGTVRSDGSFELGTAASDDGAVLGVHRVVVTPAVPAEAIDDPQAIARHRATVDRRYQDIQSTPLEVTVKDDGSANDFEIVLER